MEVLFIGALGVIAITSILLQRKKQVDLVPTLQLLFGLVVLLWLGTFFGDEGRKAMLALGAVLAIAFLALKLMKPPSWLRIAFAPVLMLGFYFLFGRTAFTLDELVFLPEDKFMLAAIVLASLGMNLSDVVLKALKKWISPNQEANEWKNALSLLFAGLAIFLSAISAPVLGTSIIAVTFWVTSLFQYGRNGQIGISMYVLAAMPVIASGSYEPMLLNADVIGGLILGAFSMVLIHNIWKSNRPNSLQLILGYGLAFGIPLALGLLQGQIEIFGGRDAYVAAIFGAALLNAKIGNGYEGVGLFSGLLVISMLLPVPVAEDSFEGDSLSFSQSSSGTNGSTEEPLKRLSIQELSGEYAIQPESSEILFQLGKNGATKGKFKKVNGSFTFGDTEAATKASVVLEMSDFTTLNSMRDEELRGDGYFKVNKFPRMIYKITGLEQKGEMEYVAKGQFTMLGVTKSQDVTLVRIEMGDAIVLQGSGSIDRTKFGMDPSAAEGNVVSFEYRVTLQK